MAEVGVSVLAKLSEYLVDPTLQQLQYLFCVGKITRNVEIRKEELILKQGSVHELVQEAINRTERIDGQVTKWTNDVRSLITEVENLEEELRGNSGCLRGWCPTWKRYCLCKKLAKTTQRIMDLSRKRDLLNTISHHVAISDIENPSSEDFMFFKSTKMAYDAIWDALQDDDSSLVGLWGMGGSGKTTLVTEVGKKAKKSKLFDRVLNATISQSPNIMQIQDVMIDMLGLKLEEKSQTGRAQRIALRLQSGERILIILDDVWAKLNLEDIGIPSGGNHQISCKVVLTTRRLKVCTSMKCQKIIQLDLLKEDEAWTLFQTHANVDDAIKDVAQAIAMECKGLPIAIVAVGTCLKGKEVDEMNAMLYILKNAKLSNVVDEEVKHAFTCLELSYNYLATSEAKLLLLMCAMFPEDHNIYVEELFIYGMGLGLFRGVDSFETARSQVGITIKHLIDSSLLMHSPKFNKYNKHEYVTMHDVVRDFVLWKASEDDHTIKVNYTKEWNELIADEMVKDCYVVSSWHHNNKLLQFSSQLDAPKLEFLLLRCYSLDISHASFEGTKQLKALIIMCMDQCKIELHPQQIQHLSNLRTLRLRSFDLLDISFVVSLTSLEILDLKGSKFERVPNGIEKLNKLKLLDLSLCTIDECCYKVIGRCLQLEELYVSTHSQHSKNENCYENLEGPTALQKLRMYNLRIGGNNRVLQFQNEGTRATIKDLAQRANAIQFSNFVGGDNIVQAVGGMNELKKLSLEKCSEIECIFYEAIPREDVVVPILDELVIQYMDNLKQICHGPSSFIIFQKLERLGISYCRQLLHIFPANCTLGNLKVLRIYDCRILISLFPVSVACTLLSLEELEIEHCNELRHVLEGDAGGDAWNDSTFPKLKTLSVKYCLKLEYICPVFLAQRFVKLQDLSISDAPQMKFVFGENVGEEQPMHDQDKSELVLPLLEEFRLQKLPNLVAICSKRYHTRWPSIKKIHWGDCPNMELQELEGHQLRNDEYKLWATIESIYLYNCKAESIFRYQTGVGELIEKFQHLQKLTVERSARLKFMFSVHICQSLPQLTSLTVSYCDELEAMVLGNEETQKNLSAGESCMSKLKKLEINGCNKLKFILYFMSSVSTSMLPQLSTLSISDCSQIEEIFKCSNIEDHDIDNARETIVLSNLRRIELTNLPNFVSVCQGFQIQVIELSNIKVSNCPKFVDSSLGSALQQSGSILELQKLKGHQVRNEEYKSLTSIKSIELHSCGVESIFHYQSGLRKQIPAIHYLEELTLKNCARLKFVFSADLRRSLPELTSVIISCCEELEAVFLRNDEETHNNLSIAESRLSKLKSMEISECNKLKFILSFNMISADTSMVRQLSTLRISDCSQMEEIFKCSNIEHHDIDSKREITFPNMKYVNLENLPKLVNVCQGFNVCLGFCYAGVRDSPKFMPFMSATISWTETLLVRSYKLKYSQLNNNEGLNLPLSVLTAGELDNQSPKVKHNWQIVGDDDQEEQQMQRDFVLSQILSLQYLHSLDVTGIKKLKFLFSMNTIVHNSLPKLTSLTLSDCEELEEIVTKKEEHQIKSNVQVCFPKLGTSDPRSEDDANYGETIVLSSLKTIKLRNLPNFKSVCQVGLHIQVVKLSNIKISNCPKFVDSSLASVLQQLGTSTVSVEDSNLQTSTNVEEELRANEQKRMKVVISRAKYLRLEDSINLTSAWEGPTIITFRNLRELKVIKYRRLKCIFTSTIIRRLPCLKALLIKDCEELEEVMPSGEEEHNHFPNESSNFSLCFPQLFLLTVIRCRKLKWIFPSLPSTLLLPRLTMLRIKECSQLKGLRNSEVEIIHEEGFYKNLLHLTYLTVSDCPNFSETTLAALQSCVRQNKGIDSDDDDVEFDDDEFDDYEIDDDEFDDDDDDV